LPCFGHNRIVLMELLLVVLPLTAQAHRTSSRTTIICDHDRHPTKSYSR